VILPAPFRPRTDFRFWHLADIVTAIIDVCFQRRERTSIDAIGMSVKCQEKTLCWETPGDCAVFLWLPGNSSVCYRLGRNRVHLGNVRSTVRSGASQSID
jgi:hypothetical protein